MTKQERMEKLLKDEKITEENYKANKISQEKYTAQKQKIKLKISELKKAIQRKDGKKAKRLIEIYESVSLGYDHISDCTITAKNIKTNGDEILADVVFKDPNFKISEKQRMKYSFNELRNFEKEKNKYGY